VKAYSLKWPLLHDILQNLMKSHSYERQYILQIMAIHDFFMHFLSNSC